MDKILITAFLSALAGFITAVLSVVKLVNEKESKTTDYRQSWTDSVRKTLAELISNLNTQASLLVDIGDSTRQVKQTTGLPDEQPGQKEIKERVSALVDTELQNELSAVREMRREIYKSYAFTRLHFKPNDPSFNRIEQKFDVVMGMIGEFKNINSDDKSGDRRVLKEKIHSAVGELTNYARDILKTEWETVKKGEAAYQATKRWSFIGGTVMLAILVSIGVHASIAMYKSAGTHTMQNDLTSNSGKPGGSTASVIDVRSGIEPLQPSAPPSNQVITNHVQCAPAQRSISSQLNPSRCQNH